MLYMTVVWAKIHFFLMMKFLQKAKLRFLTMFQKISEFSNKSQVRSLKVRGLIFWILALYICILAPVKTEFENH